jgi:hypothetical protein
MKIIPEKKINEIFAFWRQYYDFQFPSVIALILNLKEWKKFWHLRKAWHELVEKLEIEGVIQTREAKEEEATHARPIESLSEWVKGSEGFVFSTKQYTQFKDWGILPYQEFLNLISPFEWAIVLKSNASPLALFEEVTHIVEEKSRVLILPENRLHSEKILMKFFLDFLRWKGRL